jgi:hypothetical protein
LRYPPTLASVGLVGGAISFDETINARLPYQSLFLAGMALLLVVAVPMTAAAVGCIRDLCYASELVIGAGLLPRLMDCTGPN